MVDPAMVDAAVVWQAVLDDLQLQMTKATFDTWVKQTVALAHEGGAFFVGVHNGYAKDWLENRLMGSIKRSLTGILNQSVDVKFVVQTQPSCATEPAEALQLKSPPLTPKSQAPRPNPLAKIGDYRATRADGDQSKFAINSNYTFCGFIVGSSNRLAHAASLAVAEQPATAYNPLFLYGGVGMGKTHLLHAIGNYALTHRLKVLYLSSETFTNDLINSIRTRSTEAFRDCYRGADYLLVDDIQFIAGKESTQEEFFHTFNALHASGRQIVVSSDRPPQAIPTLEERLASRFQWGLIADIQPPDLETRIAILRAKADTRGACIPDDVTYLIARQMHSNIRELEGGLNRVLAHAALTNEPVTMELAQQTLSSLVARKHRATLPDIISAVSSHYGIRADEILGPSRQKEYVLPRHMVMYMAREETTASLPEIGQALGGRDHTTVLYGKMKMAAEIQKKDTLRRDLLAIRERLYRDK